MQRVYKSGRVVQMSQGGNVAPSGLGVERHQARYLQLVRRETAGPGEGFGEILEDLSSRDGVVGDENVVQREPERDLDGHRAIWDRLVRVVRQDDLGNSGWQSLRRGGGRGGRRG